MTLDATVRKKLEAILTPSRVLTRPEDCLVFGYDGTHAANHSLSSQS